MVAPAPAAAGALAARIGRGMDLRQPGVVSDSELEAEKKEVFSSKTQVATFAGGCFWCVEASFLMVNGVISVQSGYAGGHVKNPTYKEVCSGLTGHAEVAQIVYDNTLLNYDDLL